MKEPAPEASGMAVPDTSAPAGDGAREIASAADPVSPEDEAGAEAQLEAQLAAFKVPPEWLDSVTTEWNVAEKPWSEARLEIRRLLGLNDDAKRREGLKLTWDYLQKQDIGNGHEYGMYTFLGKEPLWAIIAFRQELGQTEFEYPPYFALNSLASIYSDYGVYSKAEELLLKGLEMPPPDANWSEMRQAEMQDSLGDLYAAWGRTGKAKASYQESVRLYPLAKPPYGKHLLPRRAAKVQSKLDLLTMAFLDGAKLKDGVYHETSLGYSGDIELAVTISGGKISDIGIKHQEKIDQNACALIPERIVAAQSLQVDGVSGATVTKDAILDGALRALKQAGLQ